jgi:hypothetical protein
MSGRRMVNVMVTSEDDELLDQITIDVTYCGTIQVLATKNESDIPNWVDMLAADYLTVGVPE